MFNQENKLNFTIAGWLRHHRLSNDLRQRDVAKVLQVSHQSINKYEHSLCKMSADSLLKLTNHYGWSLNGLIKQEGDNHVR